MKIEPNQVTMVFITLCFCVIVLLDIYETDKVSIWSVPENSVKINECERERDKRKGL